MGFRAIDMEKGLREALQILRQGGAIGILGDRHYGGRTAPVRFFGREVPFPTGPARLAASGNADLLPLFAVRRADGGYSIRWHAPIPVRDKGEGEITAATQRFAEVLEGEVRNAPTQWTHFFPFFEQANAS